ncbi:MAG: hypothetical protein LBN43_09305, partial [Oscillospiraceae bacterium]|nr:hypothetical protein [Oscillospiraceae bacterium]
FGDSVIDVVSAPGQFAGYQYGQNKNPSDFAVTIASGVLRAYYGGAERPSGDYARNIEPDILYFTGDGYKNHFGSSFPVKGGFTFDG